MKRDDQNKSLLSAYLKQHPDNNFDTASIAFYAAIDQIGSVSPTIARSIVKELFDQKTNLKLIASENFSSLAVQFAQGNLLTDKYAEGNPAHRFYAGCDNVDAIETEAAELACDLFCAEHAYVQPHSGADANLLAFIMALSSRVQEPVLEKIEQKNLSLIDRDDWNELRKAFLGQKLLALDYYSGGHLTHGYRHNFSSILFDAYSYMVDRETNLIDMDALRRQIHEIRPFILLAGYSAYPRKINFAKMREFADEVGAVFIVDMSHFAGLVAGKVFQGEYDPMPYAHIVTSTTHKTLRGPRGGIVLCKKEFAEWADKGCPAIFGGPLPHVMAAKAVAFREAMTPSFEAYAHKIVENSQTLSEACISESMKIVTGGTDNHLMLVDVTHSFGLTGRQAESALRKCKITLNRNSIPFDQNGPWYTSGLRIGTPAITTLGMGKVEMKEIARIIKFVLSNTAPDTNKDGDKKGQMSFAKFVLAPSVSDHARKCIDDLLQNYPLYPNLDIKLIRAAGFLE